MRKPTCLVVGGYVCSIARFRAEIENGDAWTDSPLAAKSEVDKVMADLRGFDVQAVIKTHWAAQQHEHVY